MKYTKNNNNAHKYIIKLLSFSFIFYKTGGQEKKISTYNKSVIASVNALYYKKKQKHTELPNLV